MCSRWSAMIGEPAEGSLDLLRWGLIPHWAKDINVGFANINAKAEGIENRPAFPTHSRGGFADSPLEQAGFEPPVLGKTMYLRTAFFTPPDVLVQPKS
jgi:hypothetical protein